MASDITLFALIRCCYVSSLCCVEEEVLSFQLTGLISLFLLLSLLFSLKFGCLPAFFELFHSLGFNSFELTLKSLDCFTVFSLNEDSNSSKESRVLDDCWKRCVFSVCHQRIRVDCEFVSWSFTEC